MKVIDIFVLILVTAALIFALRLLLKKRKGPRCQGCGINCGGCKNSRQCGGGKDISG